MPVVLCCAYVWQTTGRLPLAAALVTLAACVLVQTGTNLFNEYFDYMRGLDTPESVGISGAIVRDGLLPVTVLMLALGAYGAAMLCGLYLCAVSSWWLIPVGMVCMAIGFFYAGGPLPISATPLGELFSGGAMGCGIICITEFILTGAVSGGCVALSVSPALLIAAILTSNNLRDREGDAAHDRHTLVILLGHRGGTALLAAEFAAALLWLGALVWRGVLPWPALLGMAALVPAVAAVRGFIPAGQTPGAMMAPMRLTAVTNTVFCLGCAAGLIAARLFHL